MGKGFRPALPAWEAGSGRLPDPAGRGKPTDKQKVDERLMVSIAGLRKLEEALISLREAGSSDDPNVRDEIVRLMEWHASGVLVALLDEYEFPFFEPRDEC